MVKLPKGRLSYSMWLLFHKNKNQFRERYYENAPSFETRETIFGKQTAGMLEKKDAHPILVKVPRGEITEFEIRTEIKGIPILGFLDSFTPATGSLFEIKTGKIIWNQTRVNEHDQLPFYIAAIQAKFGYYDPCVLLCWLETELKTRKETIGGIDFENDDERDKQVELTGRIEVFTRKITDKDIIKITESIVKTAYEIEEDWNTYCNVKRLDI